MGSDGTAGWRRENFIGTRRKLYRTICDRTQTGGRVGFFLETSNFTRDHARMMSNGVEFLENPRRES